MSSGSEWRVEPKSLDLSSIEGVGKPGLGVWGCFGPILMLVIAGVLRIFIEVDPWWYLLAPAALLAGSIVYLDAQRKAKQLEAEYRDRIEHKRNSLARSAEDVRKKALSSLHEGEKLTETLRGHLDQAQDSLQLAQHEFSERAFGPFWDVVEKAGIEIGMYRDGLYELSSRVHSYHYNLDGYGYDHNFPNWQDALVPLPTPGRTLEEFQRIVRLGQTDYEFSSILEPRLTRRVRISGFKDLGAALSGLSESVEEKFADFQLRLGESVTRKESQ